MNSIKLKYKIDTEFMNSENSKISYPHRLSLNLSGKINLKRKDKYVVLSNVSICYAWKNIKKSNKNNKLKKSASTWNEKVELAYESYSASDTHNYFEYFFKKHHTPTDNRLIKMYVNKIENRILSRTFNTWKDEIT